MNGTRLDEALDRLLAAEGLGAKLAVLAGATDVLLTDAAEQALQARAAAQPATADGPFLHAFLLRRCREAGLKDGANSFANFLANRLLEQPALGAKVALVQAWADPLLSDQMLKGFQALADGADDAGEAARRRWHVRLLERCREAGIEAGAAAHQEADGAAAAGDAAQIPEPFDPVALLDEMNILTREDRSETWVRQTEILEALLARLPAAGAEELELGRALFCSQLATTLTQLLNAGLLDATSASAAAARAHALYDEALAIRRRHERWVEVATTAQNQASLLRSEFEAGDASAAARAHALYDEALAIVRRHERWVEVAQTAQNQANLLLSEFNAGDASAAARAHALYDEALAIFHRHERWVEVAKTAQNQASLLLSEFDAGDASAAARAHALYDEALAIRRRHERWIEVAETAQNQAILLAREFEAGDASAAARAHALYDEALAIRRRHERWVEVATTAQNQAILLTREFEAGDASAAARAHALYDEALAIRRRHERWVEVATTAQNQASLLRSEFEAGDASAAARAHALYDEALAIFHRHERWVEVATTAQNQANLLASELGAGDASAAARAHALYDEALGHSPFDAMPIQNLMIRRNMLRLLEAEDRSADTVERVAAMLADVRRRLPTIGAPASRRRLLAEIRDLGMRGAAAALEAEDTDQAIAMMEAGRTVELGARLREAEAQLNTNERAALDGARAGLEEARRTFESALLALGDDRDPDVADPHVALRTAETQLAERNTAFAELRADLDLELDTAPPDAGALRKALGPDATLVVPWLGRKAGGLLLLIPRERDWQRLDLPNLTTGALDDLLHDWFDGYGRFHGDLRSDVILDEAAKRFSVVIDRGCRTLWTLVMGPMHTALGAQGVPLASGAPVAPEVVICPPGRMSVLPLAAASDPASGRSFIDDYAVRMVPSLHACLSTASRSRAEAKPSLVAVTNPQDDLPGIDRNPALPFFDADSRTDLRGYRNDPRRHDVATPEILHTTVARIRPTCFSFYGHGGWDPSAAENSAINLAAPLGDDGAIQRAAGRDGRPRTVGVPFSVPAIRDLKLNACRLAVLAGCETGMIDLNENPDEFIGLPAALLEAGAAAVLATLWPVEAGATYALIGQALAAVIGDDKIRPAQALRNAQMALRDDPRALDPDRMFLGPGPAGTQQDNCPRPPFSWAFLILVGA